MKIERIFLGIVFILGAAFLIISSFFNYFPNINVFSLVLTAFLGIIIVKNVMRMHFPGILFPIALICIIYEEPLGITNITPWPVLMAALLGSIGLSMVFDKQWRWGHRHRRWIHGKYNNEDYRFDKVDIEDGSYVKFETSCGASIKYINTNQFEQADLSCSFGSMKVYFDNAVMCKNNATARINSSCGAIELYVPKTWYVEDKTNVFVGSVDEKNKNNETTTNTLTLVGNINFSSVEIIYI